MKQKLFWAMLPFMALSFVSCEDEEPDVGFDQTSQAQEFQSGEIRLGKKINSPVTLRSCLNFITELILSFTLFFFGIFEALFNLFLKIAHKYARNKI